jgi:hypothetical protein
LDELLVLKLGVGAANAVPVERIQVLLFDFIALHLIEHEVVGTSKQPRFGFFCFDVFLVDPQFFKAILYNIAGGFDISQEMQTEPIQRIAVEVHTGIVVVAVQNCVWQ